MISMTTPEIITRQLLVLNRFVFRIEDAQHRVIMLMIIPNTNLIFRKTGPFEKYVFSRSHTINENNPMAIRDVATNLLYATIPGALKVLSARPLPVNIIPPRMALRPYTKQTTASIIKYTSMNLCHRIGYPAAFVSEAVPSSVVSS